MAKSDNAAVSKELDEALLTDDFELVWERAGWMFKNDKQDARYFYQLGQRSELLKENHRLKENHGGKTEDTNV